MRHFVWYLACQYIPDCHYSLKSATQKNWLLTDKWFLFKIVQHGRTVLMTACINGSVGIVDAVLRAGADINATDEVQSRDS